MVGYKNKYVTKKDKRSRIKVAIYEDVGIGGAKAHFPRPKMAE